MKAFYVIMILSIAGCNTASPGFMGVPAKTVTVGQSTFDVRRKGDEVELVRTNMEFAPSLPAVLPRAAQAVMLATGCAPVDGTWSGDAALIRVAIDCDG